MPETNREWKLPKNVRQIGDGGGDRKIYIEDYVITFLEGVAEKGRQKKGMLFGEVREREEIPYIFVDGALEVESFSPDNAARDELQAQMEKYFSGKEIVGWYICAADTPFVMTREITETFQKEFPRGDQILLARDSEEKENFVFMMDGDAAAEQPGYYIYYEKNPAMQEYMISRNAGKSVETEKPVKDDAIRRVRKIIKEKKKLPRNLPSVGRLAYLAGGFLVVTVLALGVTMVYNYDKMKEVERSLARLTNNVDSQSRYLEDDADTAPVMLHLEDAALQQEIESADSAQTEAAQTPELSGTSGTDNGADAGTETESPDAAQTASGAQQTESDSGAQSDVPASAVARASYTVKMGDTLAGISEMYYGDLGKVSEICDLNGIEDENTILPGQKILLP